MYRYQVTFTRRFTAGPLSGLEVQDSVRFATLAAAEDWADAMKVFRSGLSRGDVVGATVQPISN